MSDLTIELRKLAHAPTVAPSSVYANACRDAYQEIEWLRAKLKGAEVALARDGDIDAAMRCILSES